MKTYRFFSLGFIFACGLLPLNSPYIQAQNIDLLALPTVQHKQPAADVQPKDSLPKFTITSPESQDDFTGNIGIDENNLDIRFSSIGAPYPDGYAIAKNSWQNAERAKLSALIAGLYPSTDPELMQLLRDLLLAEAALPNGTNDRDFLHLRAKGLFRLGLYSDAIRLLNNADQIKPNNEALSNPAHADQQSIQTLKDTSAAYLFRVSALCPRPQPIADHLFSQKLHIFCLFAEGKPRQAEIQTQLLREDFPQADNGGFALMANLMALQENALPEGTYITPEPLHLAFSRLGRIPPRFAADTVLSLEIQRMLMELPDINLDDRLELAEAAFASGYADSADIRRLQFARQFNTSERANAVQLLQQFPSSISRALGVQLLDTGKISVSEMLAHGDEYNRYNQMLHSVADYLPAITNQSDMLARAYMGLGRFAEARTALPATSDNWLLQQVLKSQTVSDTVQVQSDTEQNDFLSSLIIDEKVDPWQVWRESLEDQPDLRSEILTLLPSLVPNIASSSLTLSQPALPEWHSVSTHRGEALLRIAHLLHFSEPQLVRRGLFWLEQIGYADIAKAYAARRLAVLLKP